MIRTTDALRAQLANRIQQHRSAADLHRRAANLQRRYGNAEAALIAEHRALMAELWCQKTTEWLNGLDDPREEPAANDDPIFESRRLREQVAALESQVENLQRALQSSRRIGAAIGILMNAGKITEQVAFGILVDASQHCHRKLRDVADDVVFAGTLPMSDSMTPARTLSDSERVLSSS